MVKPTRDADQLVEVLQRVSEETGEPWWGPGEPPPKAEVQPFLWSVLTGSSSAGSRTSRATTTSS